MLLSWIIVLGSACSELDVMHNLSCLQGNIHIPYTKPSVRYSFQLRRLPFFVWKKLCSKGLWNTFATWEHFVVAVLSKGFRTFRNCFHLRAVLPIWGICRGHYEKSLYLSSLRPHLCIDGKKMTTLRLPRTKIPLASKSKLLAHAELSTPTIYRRRKAKSCIRASPLVVREDQSVQIVVWVVLRCKRSHSNLVKT